MSVIVCPEEYKDNCVNLDTLCHECLGNGCGKFLRYKPILSSSPKKEAHPALQKKAAKKKDKDYVNYARKGRGIERNTLGKLYYLTLSYASGSIGSDGDARFNLSQFDGIINKRVEHKTRFNGKNKYAPTKGELEKGREQLIGAYFITTRNPRHDYYDTRVFVEQVIFNEIFHNLLILKARVSPSKMFTTDKTIEFRGIDKHEENFHTGTIACVGIKTLGALRLHEYTLNNRDYVFVKYNGSIFLSCSLDDFSHLITQLTEPAYDYGITTRTNR